MAQHRGSSVPAPASRVPPAVGQLALPVKQHWAGALKSPNSQRKQGALQSAGQVALAGSIASTTKASLRRDSLTQGNSRGLSMHGGSEASGGLLAMRAGAPGLQISTVFDTCHAGGSGSGCLQAVGSPLGVRSSSAGKLSFLGGFDGNVSEDETSAASDSNSLSMCISASSGSAQSTSTPMASPKASLACLSLFPSPASQSAPVASPKASMSSLRPVAERAAREQRGLVANGLKKWRFMADVGNNATVIWKMIRERPGWSSDSPRKLLGAPNMKGAGKYLIPLQDMQSVLAKVKAAPILDAAFFAVMMPNFLWAQKLNMAFLDTIVQERGNAESAVHLHNHFEGIAALCTKCGLTKSLSSFYLERGRDPFGATPLSFVVHSSDEVVKWRKAFEAFDAEGGQRMWLVKPGGWSNKGSGICVYNNADDIAQHLITESENLKKQDSSAYPERWVVQKYMEQPLLIHGRKFDIRSYCLVRQEAEGGAFSIYFYEDAYLRTTSAQYTTKSMDKMAHLNNDAVQCEGNDYGKYEPANKLSLDDFQRYLDHHRNGAGAAVVREKIIPQMKSLMADAVRSVLPVLNPRNIDHCFEVFGFDFMVDGNYRVWLIEVNTNPCLELCNTYLSYLIPKMLDEALHLTVDRLFPPESGKPPGFTNPRWTQIFNSDEDADGDVSCGWLPPASGKEVDPVSLGRDLLAPVSEKRKPSRRPTSTSVPS